jgi:hypothetical protein
MRVAGVGARAREGTARWQERGHLRETALAAAVEAWQAPSAQWPAAQAFAERDYI